MELSEKSQSAYDDQAKEAAELLLERFWILREEDPDAYRLIREREQPLSVYFREKLGFRLIVHRHFAKLEKIPATPEPWMGIQAFKDSRDYVLFCVLLAFLETKSVDEQFLLSECCEELKGLYPGEIDWTHYEHRKSLVRVLQFARELSLVLTVDGDIEQFRYAETSEVLYEVPVYSRYFMRAYPKDLFMYDSMQDLLNAEYANDGEESTGVRRRHRVYRQLFLTPAMFRSGDDDADFHYLRTYRHRIREDIENHTNYRFELYRNTAMLTRPEPAHRLDLYPDQKAISDIALQFADRVWAAVGAGEIPVVPNETVILSPYDVERILEDCKAQYDAGWSKRYRVDQSVQATAQELIQFLQDWKMVVLDQETGMLTFYPHMVRTVGRYPKDFHMMVDRENQIDEIE